MSQAPSLRAAAYGEAYAAMASTYRHTYLQNRSSADLAMWRIYMAQAIRWKKDIRYVADLIDPPQLMQTSMPKKQRHS